MLGTLDFRFRAFGSLEFFLEDSLAGISIPIFWILFLMHFFCEDSVGNENYSVKLLCYFIRWCIIFLIKKLVLDYGILHMNFKRSIITNHIQLLCKITPLPNIRSPGLSWKHGKETLWQGIRWTKTKLIRMLHVDRNR